MTGLKLERKREYKVFGWIDIQCEIEPVEFDELTANRSHRLIRTQSRLLRPNHLTRG